MMIKLGKIPKPLVRIFIVCCVLYFGLIVYGIIQDIDPSKKQGLFIPLNDPEAEYIIDCRKDETLMLHYYKEGYPKDKMTSNFIGSSPVDLEQFCGQQVEIAAHARNRRGLVLCTQEGINKELKLCTTAKTAVIDIDSITKK